MSLFGWRTPARTLPGQRAGSPGHGTDRFPGRPASPAPARFGTVAAIVLAAALLSGCAAAAAGPTPVGAAPVGAAPVGAGAAGAGRGGSDLGGSERIGADTAGLDSIGTDAAGAGGGGSERTGADPADAARTTPPPPPTLWPPVPPALAAAAPRAPEPPRASADLAGQPAPVSAPVRVTVDALEIDMPIEPVGLADDGALALPANPAVAAWYRYGPGPGSAAGATVVAAHVDSLVYDLGPFARLADAPAGTEIVVHTSDGSAHRYTIASINTVEKQAVPWAGVFDRAGEPRLTLVTCGGEFDYAARRYLSNVIVTAVPAP